MRKKLPKIPDSELEIMKIVWASNEPLSSTQIIDSLPKKNSWKRSTILTLITRLANKGALSADKEGNSFLYSPLISEKDIQNIETKNFINKMFSGNPGSLVATLCSSIKLSEEDIAELRKFLDGGKKND